MRRWWWKALTVVILIYVIIAGLGAPLKPGIERVEPGSAKAGELVVVLVRGYNTNFRLGADERRAWLKLNDSLSVRAEQVIVMSPRGIRTGFYLPVDCPLPGPRQVFSIVIDDPYHGSIVMPSALFVSDFGSGGDTRGWVKDGITDLHHSERFAFPFRPILYETIRNTYFHVPMWFGMIIMLFISAFYAIRYIRTGAHANDGFSHALATTGTVFGVMGLLTGMLWSAYTWGAPWSFDVKQNTAAIAVLIYLAYFILRASFDEPQQKARISAVYNVFGCAMLIPLLFVIPRMTDSLHPGSGGNPAMGGEDLDNTMRMVFYPAVIGWTLLGIWISNVFFRYKEVRQRLII